MTAEFESNDIYLPLSPLVIVGALILLLLVTIVLVSIKIRNRLKSEL